MAIDELIEQCQWALQDEVKAVRKGGGHRTYISDGRLLGQRLAHWVYSFTADTELQLADDTPVDLEVRGRKSAATVVSLHGFDIILVAGADLGEQIPTAILSTAPWFLLEELQKRLKGLQSRPASAQALPIALAATTEEGRPPDVTQARTPLRIVFRADQPWPVDEDQLAAIGRVLVNPVSFIWGPPGTGKTKTLAYTAAALIAAGQSVLILAHSNASCRCGNEASRSKPGKPSSLLRRSNPATWVA